MSTNLGSRTGAPPVEHKTPRERASLLEMLLVITGVLAIDAGFYYLLYLLANGLARHFHTSIMI